MKASSKNHMARWLASVALLLLLSACGGGGGGGGDSPAAAPAATPSSNTADTSTPAAAQNVLQVVVDAGVNGNAINSPFVTLTVCQPGTQTCQQIDHILVDTGSTGLRLTASAVGTLGLPTVSTSAGPVAECAHFASGFAWGAVRSADIRMGGRTAASAPIQVVGDTSFPNVPTACSGTGGSLDVSGAAKGILGVGLFAQDCGVACELSTSPQIYFTCPGGTCTSSRIPAAQQVTNPVALLSTDNNGVVLTLPAVPTGGIASLTGTLTLGIGTQANNQLGSAAVFSTDAQGYFRTVYKGVTYGKSFLDTGSNGLFFADSSIPACTNSTDFYCPATPLSLTATQVSSSGVSRDVEFTVESVDALRAEVSAASIGGGTGSGLPQSFDWGLPFFFGRTVFTAISGAGTPAGPGPYWAW
ncbi:MAG: DUF3443 domain-containing protein [Ramlibacter sp.]